MIAPENVHKFAWIGADFLSGEVSGIVLRFPGLGNATIKTEADLAELEWGHRGALVVIPYHDPWGWMNPRVVSFMDELIDGIRARHALGGEVPLISTGGSMGGHAALLYSIRSRHKVAACLANCPVCDLPFHYSERVDLPRTMHHAFGSYGDITEALRANSPLHQVDQLPDIPYLLLHGALDPAVNKQAHSDPMVAAMRRRHLRVEYIECPLMLHCGPLDYETSRRISDFIMGNLAGNDL
jgi:alpha-beta hydrolase superfamily lysophospholipase